MTIRPRTSIALNPVESSNLAAAGYDEATNTFAVQFKSGGIGHYSGVTPEKYADFLKDDSKGRFFAANIRNAKDDDGNLLHAYTPLEVKPDGE